MEGVAVSREDRGKRRCVGRRAWSEGEGGRRERKGQGCRRSVNFVNFGREER